MLHPVLPLARRGCAALALGAVALTGSLTACGSGSSTGGATVEWGRTTDGVAALVTDIFKPSGVAGAFSSTSMSTAEGTAGRRVTPTYGS